MLDALTVEGLLEHRVGPPGRQPSAKCWRVSSASHDTDDTAGMSCRPSAGERIENPDAFLSRGDLRELGLERRAVDAVFRACPVVAFPGYSRPMIRVRDYLMLVDASTNDRRTSVR